MIAPHRTLVSPSSRRSRQHIGRLARLVMRRVALCMAIPAAAALPGCSSGGSDKAAGGGWTVDTKDVTGRPAAGGDSVRVEVYLDATVSMAGYVAGGNSNYIRFLDELEASLGTAWKRADLHFYKFGRQSREIDRAGLRAARSAAFYGEKGMSEVTGIDQVISCEKPSTVSVVVTDLFQREGDVNAIVGQIKSRCFQRGVSVAVLGVRSQFNGSVYDANVPAYPLASTSDTSTYRPFYALMFGDAADLDRLFQSLKNQPFVDDRNFVLVSNEIVRDYKVTMTKPPRSKELNARKASGPYEFNFDLLKGAGAATMLADIDITPNPNAPPFRAEGLTLTAYRRSGGGKAKVDSAVTRDITLQGVTANNGKLHATLGLTIADPPGSYSYQLLLRTGAINGFGVLAWVDEFSSDNPTPRSDPNKTLNLAKFISDLRRASSSVQQPAVAKWYVNVRKL
jgi:hypothetical protein